MAKIIKVVQHIPGFVLGVEKVVVNKIELSLEILQIPFIKQWSDDEKSFIRYMISEDLSSSALMVETKDQSSKDGRKFWVIAYIYGASFEEVKKALSLHEFSIDEYERK